MREEMREHFHIIGSTQEGKSKLLEYLIRHDIDNGRGVCFLDPSDRGKTLYNVLRYCFKKGVTKVCLIDPFHYRFFKKAPIIDLFHPGYEDASVANIMDSVKTAFSQKDAAETPRIQRYLPALLKILWKAKGTPRDSFWFTQKRFINQRDQIYERLSPQDFDVSMIDDLYNSKFTEEHLQSTINRLQPFYDKHLEMIFGRGGIDFVKMISEGWIILVNLYSGLGFEPIPARLLGTSIINELIFATDRLMNKGWKGRYNLYIDEAGDYANRKLARLLNLRAKSALRVTLAHQYYSQFEDPYVQDSVDNNCKVKIAFYIPNRDDRDRFVRNAYGGELEDRDVSYVLSGQKKQYAVIKKPKISPHTVRIPDVPEINVPKEDLVKYINAIYQYEWYRDTDTIRKSFNRFNRPVSGDTRSSKPRTKSNRKTNNNPDKAGRKSIFDD